MFSKNYSNSFLVIMSILVTRKQTGGYIYQIVSGEFLWEMPLGAQHAQKNIVPEKFPFVAKFNSTV